MQFIDLKKQYKILEDDILLAVKKVLEHGQYIMGPEMIALESELAQYVGARHAIVNASGTDALLMALMAIGIQSGDEVITTPFSFFSTAEVIALCHAKPVFVDIDPVTYNIDPQRIEAAITPKTRAIMPVSLYGQCADMDAINAVAHHYGLAVIEDGAQSFGALYHERKSCGLSTVGCTSFFPSKPLGGYGDSGACFTNDDDLAMRLKEIRIHGQNARYSHKRIGINGRMDTIQAAILLEKLKIFPDEVIMRQRVAQNYKKLLSDIVVTPTVVPGQTSVYAQYTIEVNNRDAVINTLTAQGIPTAVHYPIPMHLQEALHYLGYQPGDFPHAEKAASRVLSLPMHPYLTDLEQQQIAEAVAVALRAQQELA